MFGPLNRYYPPPEPRIPELPLRALKPRGNRSRRETQQFCDLSHGVIVEIQQLQQPRVAFAVRCQRIHNRPHPLSRLTARRLCRPVVCEVRCLVERTVAPKALPAQQIDHPTAHRDQQPCEQPLRIGGDGVRRPTTQETEPHLLESVPYQFAVPGLLRRDLCESPTVRAAPAFNRLQRGRPFGLQRLYHGTGPLGPPAQMPR